MATLLDGVNAVLKRHRLIHGTTGSLTTLSVPALQMAIDLTVDAWNEAILSLYAEAQRPMPFEAETTTITLADGDRDYSLPADLVQIRWPLVDATNNQVIVQYPGGWEQMRADQTNPSSYTGLPYNAAIRPTDGLLYMDRSPTSAEAGRAYSLLYDKLIELTEATDTFPFNAAVYRALILPVTELVRRDFRNSFDAPIYENRMALAAKLLTMEVPEDTYMPTRGGYRVLSSDPLA